MRIILITIIAIMFAGTCTAQKPTLMLDADQVFEKYPSPKYTHTKRTLTRESVKNGANRKETIILGDRETVYPTYNKHGYAGMDTYNWVGIIYSKTILEKDGFFSNYDDNDFYAMILPMINKYGQGDTESNGTIIQRSWSDTVKTKVRNNRFMRHGNYQIRMTFNKREATITVELEF